MTAEIPAEIQAEVQKPDRFTGDPTDLLPLVFARPKEAMAGARALLAADPAPHDASIAHQVIGLVERDFGDAFAAIGHLRRAVRLARRCGSRNREGDALATLGIALVHCGRTAAGLATLRTAVSRADGLTAARVRFRLGGALWVLGRHHAALDELRRAVPVLRREQDTIWTARAVTLRALIHLALGATERADRDLRTAERMFATTDQEHDSAVATHNRGLVAFRAGDLPTALVHLDEAGRRYRSLGTPMPQLPMDRCAVLLAAGLSREALDQADAAIERLEALHGQATHKAELLLTAARAALAADDSVTAHARADAACRLFAAQRRHWWSVHSRLLLLQSLVAAGMVSARLLRQAERTARRLAMLGSDESTQAHLLAGRGALALARPVTAEHHLVLAGQARHRGPALLRMSGWLAEALRAEAAGQLRRTLDACRHGLNVLHTHRLTLGASELRAQATAHGAELATLAQRACLRAGRPRQMLAWSERWRATALAVPPVRPPHDRELQADLARYRDVASRLEAARAQGHQAPVLLRERQQAERSIRARTLKVRGDGHDTSTDRPLDVRGLLAELGTSQLLEIIEVDGRLHVLLCGGGTVRRFPAGPAPDVAVEVEHARSALHRLAYRAALRPEETVALLESTGRRLEDLLLGPAVHHLGGGPVVVVPPGRLHGVPWALLPSLRDSVLSVAPSARAWLRARAVTPPTRRDVLVVGGPGLGTDTAEVTSIARIYDPVTLLAHGEATTGRVLDALDGSWLAHLAVHGTFRADSPLFSALHLDDGPLTVYDLERLRHAPYRLVLPTCDSGRLATIGADELLGLTAALLPLGTAGIVATVVPVNDEATVGLMLAFHDALHGGMTMAEALRAARTAAGDDPVSYATALSFVALGAG